MDRSSVPTTRPSGLRDLLERSRQAVSTSLAAALLACIVLLPLLGHKPLTNWDEGIYAEISREMLSFGPLVPHWNYQPWFEKPPLMLWITAAFFKLFGVTEFWARAGSALSGVFTVALLHAW
ncbi:MAG TPA: phospholipid carrier-dependent glycosyltransferase, partial [Edaphobacter sp.]|nr:phospholipid carrier-dependent glycosyltransferase [Edaphobacter sp.]